MLQDEFAQLPEQQSPMLFCEHLAAQTEGPLCLPAGGIPGPIAFGSMIDKSCLLWQDQCGEQGSCYVYQNSAMSRYTLVAGLVYKVTLPLTFTLW